MEFQIPDFAPAYPEIFLLCMAGAVLLLDLFFGQKIRGLAYAVSIASLLATILLIAGTSHQAITFNGMFLRDAMGDILKIAVMLFTVMVFIYSRLYQQDRDIFKGEYFVLALTAVLGMMVMISAGNMLLLYLGLELLSLSMYSLIAMRRDSLYATEAAMKYFVLGALASGILLYGMSMIYVVTGSLDLAQIHAAISAGDSASLVLALGLVFVVVAIGFKLGAVPFHMWVPDVYQGSPTSVTLFLGSAPKLAAFAMLMRLLVGGLENLSGQWQQMLIILALFSIGFGNITAIVQTNMKRMLAYSAISHVGFFLLGMLTATRDGYAASMFYILVYGFMTLGSFGMILLLSNKDSESDMIANFKGMFSAHPLYALVMTLLMVSLAGIPPLIGFNAKLAVINALVESRLYWVAVVAVLFSVVGAFYYLRIVKLMFFDPPEGEVRLNGGMEMRILLVINGLALIVALPWIGWLIRICNSALARLT